MAAASLIQSIQPVSYEVVSTMPHRFILNDNPTPGVAHCELLDVLAFSLQKGPAIAFALGSQLTHASPSSQNLNAADAVDCELQLHSHAQVDAAYEHLLFNPEGSLLCGVSTLRLDLFSVEHRAGGGKLSLTKAASLHKNGGHARAAFSPSGDLLGTFDGYQLSIYVVRDILAGNGQAVPRQLSIDCISEREDKLADLAFSHDGQYLAVSASTAAVSIYAFHDHDWNLSHSFSGTHGDAGVAFCPANSRVLACGDYVLFLQNDGTCLAHNLDIAEALGIESRVAWNHSGQYLITAGANDSLIHDFAASDSESKMPLMSQPMFATQPVVTSVALAPLRSVSLASWASSVAVSQRHGLAMLFDARALVCFSLDQIKW